MHSYIPNEPPPLVLVVLPLLLVHDPDYFNQIFCFCLQARIVAKEVFLYSNHMSANAKASRATRKRVGPDLDPVGNQTFFFLHVYFEHFPGFARESLANTCK